MPKQCKNNSRFEINATAMPERAMPKQCMRSPKATPKRSKNKAESMHVDVGASVDEFADVNVDGNVGNDVGVCGDVDVVKDINVDAGGDADVGSKGDV